MGKRNISVILGVSAILLLASVNKAFAATTATNANYWTSLGQGLISTVIYFFVGIIAELVGFKLLDLATSKLDLQKEISGEDEPDKKGNVAAGILAGSFSIAIAIIIAAAIM